MVVEVASDRERVASSRYRRERARIFAATLLIGTGTTQSFGSGEVVRQSAGSNVSGITMRFTIKVWGTSRSSFRSVSRDAWSVIRPSGCSTPSRRCTVSAQSDPSSRGRTISTTTSGSRTGSASSYQPTRAVSQFCWPSSESLVL
jgi:hypothetical protein